MTLTIVYLARISNAVMRLNLLSGPVVQPHFVLLSQAIAGIGEAMRGFWPCLLNWFTGLFAVYLLTGHTSDALAG
jgi:hypothetical protein